MTTPGLPGAPQILPRQPGESQYAYRKRRQLALTGETPYERRKRLGQARGLSTSEARGHAPVGGRTEYQRRAARTQQQYGLSPWEFWRNNQLAWLQSEGYSPATTGWSWARLIRAAPRLRYINEHTSPAGQLTPDIMMQASDMEATGALEKDFGWDHLQERYLSMYEYLEKRDKTRGNFMWFQDREPELPVQWWYYH